MSLHPTETEIQITVFDWIDRNIGRHPELRWVYHIPNGERRDGRTAKRLQHLGVRRGIPDIHCPVPRGDYHSLYIEVKTMTGELSQEQAERIDGLRAMGHKAEVCRGVDATLHTLQDYLGIPRG